jgi:hypothetical protein
MSRFAAHLSIVGILGSFLVGLPSSVGRTVELRTTSGDRTIIRTASVLSRFDPEDETTEELPSPRTEFGVEAWDSAGFGWEQPGYGAACGVGGGCGMGPACCGSLCVERFWVELEFLLWWREGGFSGLGYRRRSRNSPRSDRVIWRWAIERAGQARRAIAVRYVAGRLPVPGCWRAFRVDRRRTQPVPTELGR